MNTNRLHAVVGWTTFVVFLATGVYMRLHDPPMETLPDRVRMLYRSRHIYILAAALVHLAFSVRMTIERPRWLLALGAALLVASPVLLFLAFAFEPSFGLVSPLTHWGLRTLLAGIGCYIVAAWVGRARPA